MRTRRASLVAVAVVTAVNVAILLGVARDRAGEPGSDVWLEERELMLQPSRENSTTTLRWHPQQTLRSGSGLAAVSPWLDAEALAALGFDCSVRPGDPSAVHFYGRQLPRRVWVAFELGGSTWEHRVASWQDAARMRLERSDTVLDANARTTLQTTIDDAAARASRLMPVGAALELEALRAKYPDRRRHVALPAVVRVVYDASDCCGGPSVTGRIDEVLPAGIQVPSLARRVFDDVDDDPARLGSRRFYGGDVLAGLTLLEYRPRYRVRVGFSAGGRPRVEEARRLP